MNMMSDTKQDKEFRILIAECGGYHFGIDIMTLEDVILRQTATPVPMSLPHVSGLVNLRGQIVTEINVARTLQIPECDASSDERAGYSLIVQKSGQLYGFVFDRVGNVVDIAQSDLRSIPETVNQTWRSLSNGIYRNGDALVVTLDLHYMVDHIVSLAEKNMAAGNAA